MKKKWKVKIWSKFDVELGIEVEVEATEKEMQEYLQSRGLLQ